MINDYNFLFFQSEVTYASVALILIVETSEHKCVIITYDIVTCFFYTFAY